MARQHDDTRHHARAAGADAARRRDHGGDPHAAADRRGAGTVSVITTEDIDRENMQDVRDLVRNEPGVTVGNNPFRAGYQNFVIRGIGGNRVVMMVRRRARARLPRQQRRVPATTPATSSTSKT